MPSESKTTVAYAFGANLIIAVAKAVGGVMTGSVALLAEAAHSLADTMNQVFLFVSLHLGGRPADEEHPFGYGKERFFWAFLAAVFIFVAGAAFSFIEGIRALFSEGGEESFLVSYVVLAVALVAEGTSLVRALKQTRAEAEAAGRGVREYLRLSQDPTTKVVVLEDSAAVAGIVFAAASIFMHQLTGAHQWDAVGSIMIGFLLSYVAYRLGKDTKGLLLGEAALPEQRDAIRDAIVAQDEVTAVLEMLTMAIGPEHLLVAARADFDDELSGREIESVSARIDRAVREAVPAVKQLFLDPTSRQEMDHEGIGNGRSQSGRH